MDKIDLIVEMIKEMKVDHREASQKLDRIEMNVQKNTEDLEYHIKRTDQVEKHVKLIEERHSIKYLFKLVVTFAGGLGTIAGAIYGISKLF